MTDDGIQLDKGFHNIFAPPFFLAELLASAGGEQRIVMTTDDTSEIGRTANRQIRSSWPAKGAIKPIISKRNLPSLLWRDFDYPATEDYNCHMNWAPRACYVLPSNFEDQPLQFVHINWDGRLPWFASNLIFIYPMFVFAFLAAAAIIISSLSAGRPIDHMIAHAVFALVLPVVFISIFLFGPLFLIKHFTTLRNFFLIDFFVRRAIWKGKIRPNVICAPWADLEGFEITPVQIDPGESEEHRPQNRYQIRASFGIGHERMVISNTTANDLYVQELHRLLQLHFIASRPKYSHGYQEARQAEKDASDQQGKELLSSDFTAMVEAVAHYARPHVDAFRKKRAAANSKKK
jgi:hypothetical protein